MRYHTHDRISGRRPQKQAALGHHALAGASVAVGRPRIGSPRAAQRRPLVRPAPVSHHSSARIPKPHPSHRPVDCRPLTLSMFRNLKGRWKNEHTVTLEEFADWVQGMDAKEKSKLWLFTPIKFGKKRSDAGCLRWGENAISFDGVLCDYDTGTMPYEEMLQRMRDAGLVALTYTSPSYQPEDGKRRWRILCPTSRPFTDKADYKQFVKRINGVVDGGLANESFTYTQAMCHSACNFGRRLTLKGSWGHGPCGS
jgi:hypothetical protein